MTFAVGSLMLKSIGVLPIRIVKSNVSSVDPSSERKL